jgi:hypothetical protein
VVCRARGGAIEKWLLPAGAALALFYVAIVAPVVHASREMPWSTQENLPTASSARTSTGATARATSLSRPGSFLTRQFDPTPVAFLYREVERTGLRYGETLDYMAYAFIPRPLWPDKPNVTRGACSRSICQARNERSVTTSTGRRRRASFTEFRRRGGPRRDGVYWALDRGMWRISGTRPHKDGLMFLLYLTVCFGMVDMPEAGSVVVGIVYRVPRDRAARLDHAVYAAMLLLRKSAAPRVPAG